MKDYAQRRHDRLKYARRRFKQWYGHRIERDEFELGRDWRGRDIPSFQFLGLDARLLVLYYMLREAKLRQRLHWCGNEHICPCLNCRRLGKAWLHGDRRPIREIRAHLAVTE
ncbi:MAG: hypothetical protein ACO1SV_14510 [Fimbriimonas sp.]